MRPHLKPIAQQVIVITGASSGNGLATAELAVQRGAAVVLAARNGAALAAIAERLRQGGGRVATLALDIADDDAAERIAAVAMAEFGGFDTWVNNAAAAAYGTMEQLSIAEHRRIHEVNYLGIVKGSLAAARHLRQRGGGAIINMGSVLSEGAMIFQGPYSAAKHAVKAATDVLRMELERDGAPISVTLVQPSAIHTPYPERARNYLGEPPRLPPLLYDPRLVAEAVLFAAEHPRRVLRVGSAGQLIGLGRTLAPRLAERLLERFGRRLQVSATDPGEPEWRDNLDTVRDDGQIDGTQAFFVRRRSYLLEAQMHPVTAAALGFSTLVLLTLAAQTASRAYRER